MGHDQLFKDLLKAFFYDFLVLFTPDLAAAIDPASITFLDPQTFTDLPQGQLRLADLVAEVRTLDGQPELLLVHTEVQSVLDADFGYRMWEYHALLRLRHQGRLVISIALLPFKDVGEVRLARYAETIFGQEYPYLDYWQVGLRGLAAEEYLATASALAPILASLMRPGSTGKVGLKVAIAERLRASGLDEARLYLAVNFMETYLELDMAEQDLYRARLQAEGATTVDTMDVTQLTWADKILLRGREEGELQATRRVALRQARARFGVLPVDLEAALEQADGAALDAALDSLVLDGSIEALRAVLR